jgi:hypothetical protein
VVLGVPEDEKNYGDLEVNIPLTFDPEILILSGNIKIRALLMSFIDSP